MIEAWRRMPARFSAQLCLAAAASMGPLHQIAALAHHGGSVSRIEPMAPRGGGAEASGTRLEASLGYGYRRFGQVLSDSGTPIADEAAVDLHLVELGVGLGLDTGTRFWLAVPLGLSRSSASGSASNETFGLGDLSLDVQQSLLSPFFPSLDVDLLGSLGISLPTGRYAPDETVRLQTIETDAQGALDLVPNDTRTSLGAGAPILRFGAELSGQLDVLRLAAGLRFGLPLSDTEDDVRWGLDRELRGIAELGLGRFTGGLGLRWLHHDSDRVLREDGSPAQVGGKDVVGALGRLSYAASEVWSFGLDLHLPLHQEVRAVQVAESISGSVWIRGRFAFDEGEAP